MRGPVRVCVRACACVCVRPALPSISSANVSLSLHVPNAPSACGAAGQLTNAHAATRERGREGLRMRAATSPPPDGRQYGGMHALFRRGEQKHATQARCARANAWGAGGRRGATRAGRCGAHHASSNAHITLPVVASRIFIPSLRAVPAPARNQQRTREAVAYTRRHAHGGQTTHGASWPRRTALSTPVRPARLGG